MNLALAFKKVGQILQYYNVHNYKGNLWHDNSRVLRNDTYINTLSYINYNMISVLQENNSQLLRDDKNINNLG